MVVAGAVSVAAVVASTPGCVVIVVSRVTDSSVSSVDGRPSSSSGSIANAVDESPAESSPSRAPSPVGGLRPLRRGAIAVVAVEEVGGVEVMRSHMICDG